MTEGGMEAKPEKKSDFFFFILIPQVFRNISKIECKKAEKK